jgi:hypothetical protein
MHSYPNPTPLYFPFLHALVEVLVYVNVAAPHLIDGNGAPQMAPLSFLLFDLVVKPFVLALRDACCTHQRPSLQTVRLSHLRPTDRLSAALNPKLR